MSRVQSQAVARLQKEFAAFRRTHRPRTRVPQELRARVVEALDAGVGSGAVCEASGVTRTQLSRWRAQRDASGGQAACGRARAQVLTVVEGDAVAAEAEEIALDVGIGSWRLSIRIKPERGPRG
jgi:transposase-like protein